MSKTVCITHMINGNLRLNLNVIEELFMQPSLANKNIVVISIAGCLRSGKSFLLNYLLRYLRGNGLKNLKWIKNDEPKDAPLWRGGKTAVTRGIHIWNEVFLMKTDDGREVSVLLMDTQGLFDNNSSKDTDTKLFILSSLISSVQILNITSLIQERDLDNLHLCVELANATAFAGQFQGSTSSSFKLENLIFLIRDWANDHENTYGNVGGTSYLSEVLAEKSGGEELNIVRRYLKGTFKQLSCFLLPHPGLAVTKFNSFKGRNSEITDEFLTFVNIFVEDILHPDKLIPSNRHATLKTGRGVNNMLRACDEVFSSGKLLKATMLVEATAKAHYTTVVEECLVEYDSIVQRHVDENGPMKNTEFKQIHCMAKKCVSEKFDLCLKLGSEGMRIEYRTHLEKKCDKSFVNWEKANELRWKEIELVLRDKQDESMDLYEKSMEEANNVSTSMTDEAIDNLHQSSTRKAMGIFDDTEIKSVDLINKYKEKLRKRIESYFSILKMQNETRKLMENQRKYSVNESKLLKLNQRLSSQYWAYLEKFGKRYVDTAQLEEECETQKQKVMESFTEETVDVDRDQVIKYKTQLESILDRNIRECIEKNGELRRNLRETLELLAGKLVNGYEKEFLSMMKQSNPGKEFFQMYQENALKYIMSEIELRSENLDKTITEQVKNKAEQDMLKVCADVERLRKEGNDKNNENMQDFVLQMTTKLGEIAQGIAVTFKSSDHVGKITEK